MTIQPVNISELKKIKNSVIGNPVAKNNLIRDDRFMKTLIDLLNPPTPSDPQASSACNAIRTEAAHIISSLSYGSEDTICTLLRAEAPRALLFAISNFSPADPVNLKTAFGRALRALTSSIADVVGPSQYGLGPERSAIRIETKDALNAIFAVESLDVYLPLLADNSSQISLPIAQLIGTSVRTREHRTTIIEWLPPDERQKEIKMQRGWEKRPTQTLNGGWTARMLTRLLPSKDYKLQEAALNALAALSKDSTVASALSTKSSHIPDGNSPLAIVHSLTKSKNEDVQLTACLCQTNIIRAAGNSYSLPLEEACIRSTLNIVNRILGTPSLDSPQNKIKACFVLYHLITDDRHLAQLAFDRGCLDKLSKIIHDTTPAETTPDWDENEAECISRLREAALTATAAMALFSNDIRRSITDTHRLLPHISSSLSHRHPGVRYAACQNVRVLARAVAVLRTNLIDSKLGMAVFTIFKKEDEDRRVLAAALAAVCNIVTEFSPLRLTFLHEGGMPRLMQILQSGDPPLRLNALWAIKNLAWKSTTEEKRDIMHHLGWRQLSELLYDPDELLQEQAFHIIRNIAEHEDGIDMVFRELGDSIFSYITTALTSPHEDVVLQAAYTFGNLCNGTSAQTSGILSNTPLLQALRTCIAEGKSEVRRPAVSCVLELVKAHPKKRRALVEAGIDSTLRHLCEWSGPPAAVVSSPTYAHSHTHSLSHSHSHAHAHPGGGGSGGSMAMSISPTVGASSRGGASNASLRSPTGGGGAYGSWSGGGSGVLSGGGPGGFSHASHASHGGSAYPYHGHAYPYPAAAAHYHYHHHWHHHHPSLGGSAGLGAGVGGGYAGYAGSSFVDADKEVYERARLEHREVYSQSQSQG